MSINKSLGETIVPFASKSEWCLKTLLSIALHDFDSFSWYTGITSVPNSIAVMLVLQTGETVNFRPNVWSRDI